MNMRSSGQHAASRRESQDPTMNGEETPKQDTTAMPQVEKAPDFGLGGEPMRDPEEAKRLLSEPTSAWGPRVDYPEQSLPPRPRFVPTDMMRDETRMDIPPEVKPMPSVTVDITAYSQAQHEFIKAQTDFMTRMENSGANYGSYVTDYSHAQTKLIKAQTALLEQLGVVR